LSLKGENGENDCIFVLVCERRDWPSPSILNFRDPNNRIQFKRHMIMV